MAYWYKLEGKNVVSATMEEANMAIGTRVAIYQRHGVIVSTVFLALDHSYSRITGSGGKPVVFETLVSGGPMDGTMVRYSDYDDALRGHEDLVIQVRQKGFTIWSFFIKRG